MNIRRNQYTEFKDPSKLLYIYFLADLTLLLLSLFTAFLTSNSLRYLHMFFIVASIVMLIHTASYTLKSIQSLIEEKLGIEREETKRLFSHKILKHKISQDISITTDNGDLQDKSELYPIEHHNGLQNNNLSHISYETQGETELMLDLLADHLYSTIMIHENEIILRGRPKNGKLMHLNIPDNHSCIVTLDNVTLSGSELPTIQIGHNSSLILKLIGDNYIFHNGIRVPESSNLTINGEGDLTLRWEQSNRIGIGGTASQSYGNITLASSGNISITCSGNITLGIGGGKNTLHSTIRLLSGNIAITTNGQNTLGIGALEGNTIVVIDQCNLQISSEGKLSVGIGSLHGMVNIVSCGILKLHCCGTRCVAFGTLEGNGEIRITGGTVQIHYSSNCGTAVGTINGTVQIELQDGELLVHGEGSEIIGVGDHSGKSYVKISSGLLSIELFANNSFITATLPQKVIIEGGNIQCNFPDNIIPVNSYGSLLMEHIITDTDEYTQVIDTISYSYTYRASYSQRYPFIKVYLPENLSIEC